MIRILFSVLLLLFVVPTFAQSNKNLRSALLKVERDFQKGMNDRAKSKSNVLLQEAMKSDNLEDLYQVLSVAYKITRFEEKEKGYPMSYPFFEEILQSCKGLNRLLVQYFQAKVLMQYYIDLQNESDPWLKSDAGLIDKNVLEILQSLEHQLNHRRSSKILVKEYPNIFYVTTEPIAINTSLKDIIQLEFLSFYSSMLKVEYERGQQIKQQSSRIEELLNTKTKKTPTDLFELFKNSLKRRTDYLNKGKRSDLVSFTLLNQLTNLYFLFPEKELNKTLHRLVEQSSGLVFDINQLLLAEWTFDYQDQMYSSWTSATMTEICEQFMRTYPDKHWLHNNAKILHAKLIKPQLKLSSKPAVYPYQSHSIDVQSKNCDSLFVVLCRFPDEIYSNVLDYHQKRQFNSLSLLVNEFKLSEWVQKSAVNIPGQLSDTIIHIPGLSPGKYYVFVANSADYFKKAYTGISFISSMEDYTTSSFSLMPREAIVFDRMDFTPANLDTMHSSTPWISRTFVGLSQTSTAYQQLQAKSFAGLKMVFDAESKVKLERSGVSGLNISDSNKEDSLINVQSNSYGYFEGSVQLSGKAKTPYTISINEALKHNKAQLEALIEDRFSFMYWFDALDGLADRLCADSTWQPGNQIELLSDLDLVPASFFRLTILSERGLLYDSLLSRAALNDWVWTVPNIFIGRTAILLSTVYQDEPYVWTQTLSKSNVELSIEYSVDNNWNGVVPMEWRSNVSYYVIFGRSSISKPFNDLNGLDFSRDMVGLNHWEEKEGLPMAVGQFDPASFLRPMPLKQNKIKDYKASSFDYKLTNRGKLMNQLIELSVKPEVELIHRASIGFDSIIWMYDAPETSLWKGQLDSGVVDSATGVFSLNWPDQSCREAISLLVLKDGTFLVEFHEFK